MTGLLLSLIVIISIIAVFCLCTSLLHIYEEEKNVKQIIQRLKEQGIIK